MCCNDMEIDREETEANIITANNELIIDDFRSRWSSNCMIMTWRETEKFKSNIWLHPNRT